MVTQSRRRIRPDENFVVGKVKDAHGLRGELYIIIFSKEMAWLDQLKKLQLVKEEKGKEQRWDLTVGKLRPHKDGFIVKPKEVNHRTEAEDIKGALLEIPGHFIESDPEDHQFYLNEILEFQVELKDQGVVGKIVDFSSNGLQDLMVIETNLGQFEVPLVDQFVIEIDRLGERIILDLPEGLLEFE